MIPSGSMTLWPSLCCAFRTSSLRQHRRRDGAVLVTIHEMPFPSHPRLSGVHTRPSSVDRLDQISLFTRPIAPSHDRHGKAQASLRERGYRGVRRAAVGQSCRFHFGESSGILPPHGGGLRPHYADAEDIRKGERDAPLLDQEAVE